MKHPKAEIGWMAALGAAAALTWALGCGGGGGGGGTGATSGSQIRGSLSRSATVQTSRARTSGIWLARAAAWIGTGTAVAEGTTACGNPAVAASGVPVDLVLNGAVVQSTVTTADGEFVFSNLPPGDYVVRVTLPSGTISTPAVVQPGQATTIAGELDVDCHDVDGDGDHSEVELHTSQHTDDGSQLESDETENGGDFHADVHKEDGKVRHEKGKKGDRSDEQDTES